MAKHAVGKPKRIKKKPKRLEQSRAGQKTAPAEPQERVVQPVKRQPRYQEEAYGTSHAPKRAQHHEEVRKPRASEEPVYETQREAAPRYQEPVYETKREAPPRYQEPVREAKREAPPRYQEPVHETQREAVPRYQEPARREPPRDAAPRYQAPQRQESARSTRHRNEGSDSYYEDDVRTVRPPREPREPMSRSMKGAIILLTVLVLITIAALVAWDQFMVKDVVIYGLKTFNYADVVKLTGIGSNQNIFLTDLEEVEMNVERNPNIDVVDIRMILPSKIEITVSERIPTATMQVLGQYLLLDESAYVLGVSDAPTGNHMKVEGLQVTGFQMGKIVKSNEVDKLASLQAVLAAMKKRSCVHLVDEINIEDENNITMMAGEDILIKIGSAHNIEQKCAWIHDMVPSLRKSNQGQGTLHITDKNTAHFVPGSINPGKQEDAD